MMLLRFAVISLVLLTPEQASADSQEDCIAKLKKAAEAGIVYGVGITDGTMAFEVDDDVWENIDFNTKSGMAATFECAMTKPGEKLARFNILSNRTHKVLGRVHFGKLTVE